MASSDRNGVGRKKWKIFDPLVIYPSIIHEPLSSSEAHAVERHGFILHKHNAYSTLKCLCCLDIALIATHGHSEVHVCWSTLEARNLAQPLCATEQTHERGDGLVVSLVRGLY